MKYFVVYFIFTLVITVLYVSADSKPTEHEVMIKDYGVDGTESTVSLNLSHGMQPGSIIVIVSQTDRRGTIDICDEKYNNLLHMDTRLLQDRVILNSYFNKKWGKENMQFKPSIEKGAKSVTTILYEEGCFRVYVNGLEKALYKHRSDKLPRHLLAFNNKIFKIVYIATKEVTGNVSQTCS